jgi:hypothetical protein
LIADALNSNTSTWSRFGHIVEDMHHVFHTFSRWRCGFVHREANDAAHWLAKAAITNVSDRIWRNHTLYCISDVVLVEQVALSLDC